MGTQRKTMNAEAGLHQTLNAMAQESWPSQFSELWRNEFLLFISSSVCAVQFRQPKWPKLMGFSNLTPFEICLCSWESFSEEQILAIRLRADNELSCNYSKEIRLYVSQKPSEDQALPKGEIALLRRSNYWQIFEKGGSNSVQADFSVPFTSHWRNRCLFGPCSGKMWQGERGVCAFIPYKLC